MTGIYCTTWCEFVSLSRSLLKKIVLRGQGTFIHALDLFSVSITHIRMKTLNKRVTPF